MQVSTFLVITSKKVTYLESYVECGSTSSWQVMFKNQCIFFSTVPGHGSMKLLIFQSRFTPSRRYVHDNYISLQTNCAQLRAVGIRFWRHVKIGSIPPRCFCNSKRKETACNWGMAYQTVLYGQNRKENKTRNLKNYLSNHTMHSRRSVISCDILYHVADEIRSNKVSVTLQLDK